MCYIIYITVDELSNYDKARQRSDTMNKIFTVILAAVLVFAAGCSNQDTTQQVEQTQNMPDTASSLAKDIVEGRYTEAAENYAYSKDMKKIISPKFFETDISPIQDAFGAYIEMLEPVESEQDGYIIISVPVVFENGTANYNVVFDGDGQIARFNIRQAEQTGDASSGSQTPDLVSLAADFAADLMEGRYDNAYEDYPHDDAMYAAVNADEYKKMIETITQTNGEFQEIKEPYTYSVSSYTAVNVPIQMSGENFGFEIYFDAQNRIAGIQFVPYQENTQTEIPEGITEQELTADVNGHALGGTLTMPKEGSDFPCVVLVHGSGPNGRDESVGANKPFRDIAWGLAERGIAVYRYDKRSYLYPAEFRTGYELTLDDETVDDAAEIVAMLAEVDGIDAQNIYVLGHSLGGYAIPRIAQDTPSAAGYIIMAGSVRPVYELIPEQYEYLFNLDGNIDSDEKAALDKVQQDYENIQNIKDYESTDIFMGMYKAYIQDMMAYDPIETAQSIQKPVLVLQGGRDYQVTEVEYDMWRGAFEQKDNWQFKLYPSLNHLMIAGEGVPNNAEYSIQGQVDQTLIADIADFINK